MFPSMLRSMTSSDSSKVRMSNDSYKVFDSVGRRIRLRAEGVRRTRFTVDIGTVHLESVDKEASGGAELKRLLLDHLGTREQHVPESASLADVVQIVRDVHDRR